MESKTLSTDGGESLNSLPRLNIQVPDPIEINLHLEEILRVLDPADARYKVWEDTILSAVYFIENYVPRELWTGPKEFEDNTSTFQDLLQVATKRGL